MASCLGDQLPRGNASVRRQKKPPARRVDIRDFRLPITSTNQMQRRCAGISVTPNRKCTRKMLRPNLPTFRARQEYPRLIENLPTTIMNEPPPPSMSQHASNVELHIKGSLTDQANAAMEKYFISRGEVKSAMIPSLLTSCSAVTLKENVIHDCT